jgi:hypothetical protein
MGVTADKLDDGLLGADLRLQIDARWPKHALEKLCAHGLGKHGELLVGENGNTDTTFRNQRYDRTHSVQCA